MTKAFVIDMLQSPTSAMAHSWRKDRLLTLFTAFGFMFFAPGCGRSVGKAVVIDYQADRAVLNSMVGNDASEIVPLMASLLRTINERLGSKGRAEALENGNIRIRVYGSPDRKELEAIKLRASIVGNVEFRLVADSRRQDDHPFIEQARKLPPEKMEVIVNGITVAKWISASKGEFEPGEPDRQFIISRQASDRFEILVLVDSLNLAGETMASAKVVKVDTANPAVELTFNATGAAKLRQLTSNSSGLFGSNGRLLGLVVDKQILGVTFVPKRLDNRVLIGGRAMTEHRAESIVSIFNAGALSVPVREIQDAATE